MHFLCDSNWTIVISYRFQNLIEDLKSELGGKFEDLIVALCLPPVDYLCKQLHKAMSGIGTDEQCLVEILCSHSNKEIQEIVEAYERRKYSLQINQVLVTEIVQPLFCCFSHYHFSVTCRCLFLRSSQLNGIFCTFIRENNLLSFQVIFQRCTETGFHMSATIICNPLISGIRI